MPASLVQLLINFRYSTPTAVLSTTSRRLQPSANLACLLTIFFQTQLSQYLVGSFYGQILLVDVLLGWNLFVAAMAQNGGLSSDLISRIHSRASFNASTGEFPLSYESSQGSTIGGAAR